MKYALILAVIFAVTSNAFAQSKPPLPTKLFKCDAGSASNRIDVEVTVDLTKKAVTSWYYLGRVNIGSEAFDFPLHIQDPVLQGYPAPQLAGLTAHATSALEINGDGPGILLVIHRAESPISVDSLLYGSLAWNGNIYALSCQKPIKK
jgi:hypothetical protein